MLDVGGAISRPFRLDVLRLKRAASTCERDREGLVIAKLHRQLIEKSRLMHGRDVMNRSRAAQSGKRDYETECGVAHPTPAAGVTPAPDEAQIQSSPPPFVGGGRRSSQSGGWGTLIAEMTRVSGIEHHNHAFVRRQRHRRLRER